MKTKAEVIKTIESAMDGGADSIFKALMDEGCIDKDYVKDESGEMENEESPEDMKEDEGEYGIPKGMPLPEARGIAVKFAMKGMDKDKGKKGGMGGMGGPMGGM